MKSLIASALVLVAFTGCGRNMAPAVAAAATRAPEPDTVIIPPDSPMLQQLKRQQVSLAELPTGEVIAPGKIEANPNRVAKIVLPVTGRIANVLVKTGDAVQKNQPLLTIDSPDGDAARSAALSAQASVVQAQAVLAKAQSDFDRASDLFEHDAVAKKDVLSAESALTQAKAGAEQAEAAREQAVRHLAVLGLKPGDADQGIVLRAPLSGKVMDLSVVRGEFRNDTNASLMTIADLSTVWVASQVPESDIRFVQVGERVEISLVAYPGDTFDGRVSRIADTVDPQTRTVKVQAEMDNRSGRFLPEMFGSIHHIEATAKVAVIPSAAVVQDGNRTVVFVEQPAGHFVERPVTAGKPAGPLVRVTSGVNVGEWVVVDGVMLLKGLMTRS